MMTRLVMKKMALIVPAVLLAQAVVAQTPQNITINYPAKAPANWPLFVAKDGGYYQKYGFNANLVFGVSPTGIAMVVSGEAAMTNYSLEQAMLASSRDGSLVLVGSLLNRALFAL